MSWTRYLTGGGLACWLLIAGTAVGQVRVEVGREGDRAGHHHRRVSALMGATVTLQDNAAGGKVEDIVLNESGCVDYLVVANADRYVLVPWGAATVDFERRAITVDIPVAKFREVPTFTREKWPDVSDRTYIESVNRHYKIRPCEERREERRERRDRP